MNFADSSEISAHLDARGMTPTPLLEEADIALVNTCTVRQQAENRALSLLGRLKEWKKYREGRLVVLTGCAAERIKEQVHWRIPQVDLTVGAKDIEKFGEKLDEFLKGRFDYSIETQETFNNPPSPLTPLPQGRGEQRNSTVPFSHQGEGLRMRGELAGPVAYVTIMRGCNYSCSYCIVPSVRGRESYRPPEAILDEVKRGVEAGAKEVLLLGQTVNSYSYADHDFANLLKAVDAVPGVKRLRAMSPHPHYFDDATIDAMVNLPTVCEHVHLPVQSGSDKMLKAMKRNYTRERYLKAVGTLRKKIPGVSITTDFIVGFPGETNEDFDSTLSLIEEADFDSAYCFKYSPRPGTQSAELPDDVPTKVKEERLARLFERMETQSDKSARKLVGTKQEVLIEEEIGKLATGRTRTNWKINVQNNSLKPGDLATVTITSANGRAVKAETCAE